MQNIQNKSVWTDVKDAVDFYTGTADLIQVDPAIAEVVKILNFKGYKTFASCSGHIEGSDVRSGYIWMESRPSYELPKGLLWCDETYADTNSVLRWRPESPMELLRILTRLEDWVRTLSHKETL